MIGLGLVLPVVPAVVPAIAPMVALTSTATVASLFGSVASTLGTLVPDYMIWVSLALIASGSVWVYRRFAKIGR
jgi:hypothetical protein